MSRTRCRQSPPPATSLQQRQPAPFPSLRRRGFYHRSTGIIRTFQDTSLSHLPSATSSWQPLNTQSLMPSIDQYNTVKERCTLSNAAVFGERPRTEFIAIHPLPHRLGRRHTIPQCVHQLLPTRVTVRSAASLIVRQVPPSTGQRTQKSHWLLPKNLPSSFGAGNNTKRKPDPSTRMSIMTTPRTIPHHQSQAGLSKRKTTTCPR